MSNTELAKLLERTAILKRLAGENDFKAAAYDRAARTIENLEISIKDFIENEKVLDIDGIGKSLAAEIYAYGENGTLPAMEKAEAAVPGGLAKWLDIGGLGPKKIFKIHKELGITEMNQLIERCKDGSVAKLKGMGAKTADKIVKSIEFIQEHGERCRVDEATFVAETFRDFMAKVEGVNSIEIAGSLRRRCETIGDIDLLVAAKPEDTPCIMQTFVDHPNVIEILAQGDTKASVRTQDGRQVDLRVVPPNHFAATLMYFTGNKDHNVVMRQRARDRGMALNEYGLFKLDASGDTDFSNPVEAESEKAIYQKLGLPFIQPELREDHGEFDYFENNAEIDLLDLKEIKGVLHAHSTWSDGAFTIYEMAIGCIERGYTYLGITDHSKSASYAGGLTINRVKDQWKEIDAVNAQLLAEGYDFRIFKGIESDILSDGSLDYPEDILAGFEFIIASVHSSLDMPVDEMLERMKNAAANPYCTMIGHPTGRLLLKRKGNTFDINALIEHAAACNTGIEINANPRRLDIDWRYGNKARSCGMITSINPDAHTLDMLDDVVHGVNIARKAGFNAERVLNTRTHADLSEYFQQSRKV